MSEDNAPVIPDLMDGLIPAPSLDQEMAKLCAWLLRQETPALQELPVSAIGALARYMRDRIHEDRCESFVQASRDPDRDEDPDQSGDPGDAAVVGILDPQRLRRPLPVPVGGLETMWQSPGVQEEVPELNIPRPATTDH